MIAAPDVLTLKSALNLPQAFLLHRMFTTETDSSQRSARILVVEDEQELARPVKRGLEEQGYHVDLAADGDEGEMMALADDYDALIVDWRLPGVDGPTLIRRLREAGRTMPITMLTVMRDVDHRVKGLEAGADDYLTKPFSFEELLARIRAMLRRSSEYVGADGEELPLTAGGLQIDVPRRQVILGTETLDLRAKEFRLLKLLVERQGSVVSRTVIAERVWGSAFDVTDNAIQVTVSSLRRKLEHANQSYAGDSPPVRIETERGVGYRLTPASNPGDQSSNSR